MAVAVLTDRKVEGIEWNEGKPAVVTMQSRMTGKFHSLEIQLDAEQYNRFQRGAKAQDAFPTLTPDEREFLMTGITAEEWKEVFGEDDDGE